MPYSESCWERALSPKPAASNVKSLQRIKAACTEGSFLCTFVALKLDLNSHEEAAAEVVCLVSCLQVQDRVQDECDTLALDPVHHRKELLCGAGPGVAHACAGPCRTSATRLHWTQSITRRALHSWSKCRACMRRAMQDECNALELELKQHEKGFAELVQMLRLHVQGDAGRVQRAGAGAEAPREGLRRAGL